MRGLIFATLFLGLSSGSLAQTSDPMCVLDPHQMPKNWQPPAALQKNLNTTPWSDIEAKEAETAVEAGLDELIGFFNQNPSAVQNLWDDSIEALIQVTHSSANRPELDAKARDAARNNLTKLLAPYVDLDPDWAICKEVDELLPAAIFAHRLYSDKDTLKKIVTERTNAAFRDCGSLEAAIEIDYETLLAEKGTPPDNTEDVFDLYLWSLWLIEAELYPEIKLPAKAHKFGPEAWKYFEAYRLTGASGFENGAQDKEFFRTANLAARIAHIPSGTHRFPLYVEDKPDLYRYFRENFYPVLQTGELSLLASFVDSLRQYGCTPKNDLQVRDGSRFLLKAFRSSKNRWMNYRKKDETDDDLDDDDLVHLAWKTILSLRERKPASPEPGTYGGMVRRWLPRQQ